MFLSTMFFTLVDLCSIFLACTRIACKRPGCPGISSYCSHVPQGLSAENSYQLKAPSASPLSYCFPIVMRALYVRLCPSATVAFVHVQLNINNADGLIHLPPSVQPSNVIYYLSAVSNASIFHVRVRQRHQLTWCPVAMLGVCRMCPALDTACPYPNGTAPIAACVLWPEMGAATTVAPVT